jgi:hypothetical protein
LWHQRMGGGKTDAATDAPRLRVFIAHQHRAVIDECQRSGRANG